MRPRIWFQLVVVSGLGERHKFGFEQLSRGEVIILRPLMGWCISSSTWKPRVLRSMSSLPLKDMLAKHRQAVTLRS